MILGKLLISFWSAKILRKQQSSSGGIGTTATKENILSELVSCSLLELHLRVTVGPLQKAGIPMTGQLSHRLLVHAAVEHSGDEIVA